MQHAQEVEILKVLMQQLDLGQNIDAGIQYRMPTTAYVCPDIADQEWTTFFQNHPQLIGLSGDLPDPGSYMTLDDFGVPILATRDKDGVFRAFLNACRHRSVKVAADARGQKSVFMCPFHNWSYANTGDLLNIPDQAHFGPVDKSCMGLIKLPAVERNGLLWIHPNRDESLDIASLLGPELDEEFSAYQLNQQVLVGEKTITMNLNWKFANDTFGETYHFGKLHSNTLGRLYYGNNLHLTEFGRHHRFVTANRGIDALRAKPESEWSLSSGTFVLYHLFPNIQFLADGNTATLIRIYPDPRNPSRSTTRITFYYAPHLLEAMSNDDANDEKIEDVYDFESRRGKVSGVESALEVFHSTIEQEDYLMGEMQQRAAETGMLKEIIFGRNEPALHHFHQNYRAALGQPPLQPVE